ncbi:unnamed protein product [Adineta ricciae]|uniref:G-protein coupled receptors family 1 profile domain-containing protein n=1 Tax=Adineta ricciae TaxID=249248 RepID=A0A814JN69_ADIRI|nr:unnamed protein product [Adineta ricciae]CAF1038096.1 unnamed protein product [Adineta ricciae]
MPSDDILIQQLSTAAVVIFMVSSVVNFILGIVGLTFNVFVFARPTLRGQPCSFYFLSSTLFNFFVILIIIPLRILSNIYNIDPSIYSEGYCRIQTYAFYSTRAVSCWLITLATIDRYLHSSSNVSFRQMSSLKIAKLASGCTSLFVFIAYSHMIVYYSISTKTDRFGNISSQCSGPPGSYSVFLSIWHMIFYSVIPSSGMLIFGFLTIANVRQRRQILPRAIENHKNTKRTDSQLLRMLTAQVSMIIVCTLPVSAYRAYSASTASETKGALRLAQENLAAQIVAGITYFAHSTSFYMYTLSGTMFRKEFLKTIRRSQHSSHNQPQMNDVQIQARSTLQESTKCDSVKQCHRRKNK